MLKEYQKIPTLYKFDQINHVYLEEIADEEVKYLRSLPWLASEKYDGTNIRVYFDGHKVFYYGRTDKADLPPKVKEVLDKYFADSEVTFEQNFQNQEVILFMECYGGLVQASKARHWYNNQDESLMGFDVMVNNSYLKRQDIKPIFDLFGIPSIKQTILSSLDEAIKIVREKTDEQDQRKDTSYFEGLVLVPTANLYTHGLRRIIVKVKCDTFRIIKGTKRPARIKLPPKKPMIKRTSTYTLEVSSLSKNIKDTIGNKTIEIPIEKVRSYKIGSLIVFKKEKQFLAIYTLKSMNDITAVFEIKD